jgi:hypothetical protein
MAQKPGQSVTKTPAPATTTTPAGVSAGTKPEEAKAAAGTDVAQTQAAGSDAGHRGETTSSTLVDDATKGQADAGAVPKEAIVVAPIEPVQVPIDEVRLFLPLPLLVLIPDRGGHVFRRPTTRLRKRAFVHSTST